MAFGTTYDFDLVNSGTTSWQYFFLVGPAGTSFVGGATAGEITTHCVAGQPDGLPDEIECGPLSGAGLGPGAHTLFVATSSATAACGSAFQLDVIPIGGSTPTRVPDVMPAGGCSAAVPPAPGTPSVVTPPAVHGAPVVGGRLTAAPPSWSVTPTQVRYQWQLCAATACRAIVRATGLVLRLVTRDAGHSVRIVATASVGDVELTSASARVAVRAKRSVG